MHSTRGIILETAVLARQSKINIFTLGQICSSLEEGDATHRIIN